MNAPVGPDDAEFDFVVACLALEFDGAFLKPRPVVRVCLLQNTFKGDRSVS